jgi:PPOX class probable F420-dependent enzyme
MPMSMSTTLEGLPEWAAELLGAARVARLALLDEDDAPRVLPVTFAVWEGAVWSAIDWKPKRSAEPARLRRLRRRPIAALLVDRYDEDWTRLAWVEVRGPVAIVAASDARGVLNALSNKYGQYAQRPPAGPLIRLDPERGACWSASESDIGRHIRD